MSAAARWGGGGPHVAASPITHELPSPPLSLPGRAACEPAARGALRLRLRSAHGDGAGAARPPAAVAAAAAARRRLLPVDHGGAADDARGPVPAGRRRSRPLLRGGGRR